MNRRFCAAATSVAVAVLASACQWLVPLATTPGESDGGDAPDAPDGAVASDAGCTLHVKPPRPAPAAIGGDVSFVTVFSELSLAEPTDPSFCVPSEDLDLQDTCHDGAHATCVGPGASSCDHEGGVDRVLNDTASLPAYRTVIERVPALNLTGQVRSGRHAILVRVSRYNGGPNDDSVTVEYLVSGGLPGAGDAGIAPTFTAADRWVIDLSSTHIVDGGTDGTGAVHDDNAYVADGVLVSSVGTSLSSLLIPLSKPILVARVSPREPFYLTKGRWSGAAPVESLLSSLAYAETNGSPLCPGNKTFDQLKEVACAVADLSTQTLLAAPPCDALSASLAVVGAPASIGSIESFNRPVVLCDWGDSGAPPSCP